MKLELPDRPGASAAPTPTPTPAPTPAPVSDPLDSLTREAISALPDVTPHQPEPAKAAHMPGREDALSDIEPETKAPRQLGTLPRLKAGAAALCVGVVGLVVAVSVGRTGQHYEQTTRGSSRDTGPLTDFDAIDRTGGTGVFE